MGIKYSVLLIILLLPAFIGGASAEIYVENASVRNLTLNTAPVELSSPLDSIRSRIFTENVDSLPGRNLNVAPSDLNNSLNTIRLRIFTEDVDSLPGRNLNVAPSDLNNSLNTVRPRIFTEDVDSLPGRNLIVVAADLNNSLNAVRPRIFIEHFDSSWYSQMASFFLSPPSNNSIYIDTDGDGVIDALDQENNTPSGFWVNPFGIGRMLGDLNGNGILDSGDVTILMQKVVGMIT
ncbi:MAG: hypothetical protein OIN87_04240 [Candidatus Methanoperedens sp.]|nr:hypothetical protein [Candidatus Methanoperedens sp.]